MMTRLKRNWLQCRIGLLLVLFATASSVSAAPFALHPAPRPLAALHFQNAAGERPALADFRGQPLVLHLWATWCGPCRVELPALDRLQGRLVDAHLAILAVALDKAGAAVVQPFFQQTGISHLQLYTDRSGRLAAEVGAPGLPMTLLVDAQGREIGRHLGTVEWDEPAVEAFLRHLNGRQAPRPVGNLQAAGLAGAD